MTIGFESRARHFRRLQLDGESIPDEITKCLCTNSFALVKFTHFRCELERKAGHFGVKGMIFAVVYKLPEDGM
jgi:hypothetical protein